ncbi:hypothetical protein [Mycolicibacterium sp. CBMA 361]|uniref:hypothetical protein n=1 Tax=Mycolicibacterium sp. CBMA 361 TaxID=2606610 RepID=UPI0012DEFFFC|nr:hypothetical protein [Mycolicibacterium sp. CBMA 361]
MLTHPHYMRSLAAFGALDFPHPRTNFLKQEFWLNCLGKLALSAGVFVVSYAI